MHAQLQWLVYSEHVTVNTCGIWLAGRLQLRTIMELLFWADVEFIQKSPISACWIRRRMDTVHHSNLAQCWLAKLQCFCAFVHYCRCIDNDIDLDNEQVLLTKSCWVLGASNRVFLSFFTGHSFDHVLCKLLVHLTHKFTTNHNWWYSC